MPTDVAGQEGKLRREVTLVPLLFASLGAIIGSGWLFGSMFASNEAGPAAIFSWMIGGVVITLLALVHAELGTMFPISGGTVRYPHFSFGSLVGFTWGWITWVGAVAIPPIEALAVITYASNYINGLTSAEVAGGTTAILTGKGLAVAIVLQALFTVFNVLGVKAFAKTNAALVAFKLAVPSLAALALLVLAFHGSNFSAGGGFAPAGLQGVLFAVSTGGVFFAMFGFEQAIVLGGESTNPRKHIPLAVLGSMLIGTVLYIALQIAFIGAVPGERLSKGWDQLTFANAAGPFAGIAGLAGLTWLAYILYVDAAVSPAGAGLVFMASSSRVLYGLSRNGYISRHLERIDRRGVPIWSIVVCFVVGCLFFLPFREWQKLAAFITSSYALVYAAGPLAFAAMRAQDPERERPFRLGAGAIFAPLAFIAANLIVYFAGWSTNSKVFLAVAAGFVLLGITYATRSERRPPLDWGSAVWMWPYLGGLALLSYAGSFDGEQWLPFGWDIAAVVVFSLAIFFFAQRVRLSPERARDYAVEARDEEMAEAQDRHEEPQREPRLVGPRD